MKEIPDPRCVIQKNAERIRELRDQMRKGDDWSRACDDYYSQYDALAFPGGYSVGLQKIKAGDTIAIEDALAFLEVRPYFFRSQYIRTKLKRLLKHAPLTTRQTERFQRVLEADKKRKKHA